ncbi:ty3-gypsy retrotransposon protein [Tanacetum coccineum]
MAENTRLKELATAVERLSENNKQRDTREADHANRIRNVETSLDAIHRSIDALTRSIERLSVSHPVNGAGGSDPRQQQPFHIRQVKLDFPRFGGSDPLNWLFRAEQFFTYYDTPDAQQLTIASVHFEGSVVPWFQMLQKTHQVPDWNSLAKAIEEHFGPSQFDSPRAQLFKLTQTTSSAAEYYNQFTVLANRVEGLSDAALLDCFLSGLKEPLRREVIAQTPNSLHKAGSLARLFDEKNSLGFVTKPKATGSSSYFKSPINSYSPPAQNPLPSPSSLPPLLPKPPVKPLPQIKKLSPAEMQLRREKGLCFTCDETYTWNHKCPNKQYMVLLTSNEDVDPSQVIDSLDVPTENHPDDEVLDHHLSLNAYHGSPGVATIRFSGTINGTTVQVLLDGGSSDNYITPRVAMHARLPVEPAANLKVLIGNGMFLKAEGFINSTPLYIQGHLVQFPAYVLPVWGADIILGASWLATIGSHIADYRTSTIKFYMADKFITLVGDQSLTPTKAHYHHFKRMTATDAIAEAYTIQCFTLDTLNDVSSSLPDTTPPDLANVLHDFASVFSLPKGLPPARSHDHSIVLKDGVNAVKVRPYRYPVCQKTQIEKMVTDMLTEGLIQPSTSPFSAPVLLVRKKDGTWRFCTDYRALNAATIKDSFPMPTVDELLDELHGS